MSHAACHAALFTTELLERILVEMEMRNLLLSQRVNSKWRKVIESSTILQQKPFFEPAEPEFCWKFKKSSTTIEPDTFVKVSATHELTEGEQSSESHCLFKHGEMNMLIFERDDLEDFDPDESGVLKQAQQDRYVQAWFSVQITSAAWQYPEASWRRMLVVQPPVLNATGSGRCIIHNRSIYSCHDSLKCQGSASCKTFYAHGSGGLTTGILAKAIEGAHEGQSLYWSGRTETGPQFSLRTCSARSRSISKSSRVVQKRSSLGDDADA